MNFRLTTAVAILGLSSGLTLMANRANAGCGDLPPTVKPPSTQMRSSLDDQPRMMRTAYLQTAAASAADTAPIVGMWKFTFVAQGNPPPGPPDGTQIDFGYVTWHSDGTELTNSGARPPASGDFCMGVWKQTPRGTYRLNHFAAAWAPDGSAYVGPANIREEVTVDRGGNSYAGAFTIDQYDATESTVLAHVSGVVTATRITVNFGGL